MKSFPTETILAFLTKRNIAPGGMKSVFDFFSYVLSDENITSSTLLMAYDVVRTHLLRQHPQLSTIDENVVVNWNNPASWIDQIKRTHGTEIQIKTLREAIMIVSDASRHSKEQTEKIERINDLVSQLIEKDKVTFSGNPEEFVGIGIKIADLTKTVMEMLMELNKADGVKVVPYIVEELQALLKASYQIAYKLPELETQMPKVDPARLFVPETAGLPN